MFKFFTKKSIAERKVDALANYLGLTYTRKEDKLHGVDAYTHIDVTFEDDFDELTFWESPITTLKKLIKQVKDLKKPKPTKK